MSASLPIHDRVAVVTLDNPPVNGLGLATRQALADALRRAQADPAVDAIVVTGAGSAFSGGADIREFGTPQAAAQPNLWALLDLVEGSPKPVVAAVHSVCVGGGLELALACHGRVFAAGAQVALPEVRIGLIPGAGGTQRLPRAIDLETALEMIVGGAPVASERLAQRPGQRLVDRLVSSRDELIGAAATWARALARVDPLPRLRDRTPPDPRTDPDAAARLRMARERAVAARPRLAAPAHCIDAIEAALTLPFDAGLAREREIFNALIDSAESRALRHAFFAERAAAKVPDVPADTPRRPIARVAVVGAGTMGSGIVLALLNAGLPVVWVDAQPAAMERGLANVRGQLDAQVRKGRLTIDDAQARLAALAVVPGLDAQADPAAAPAPAAPVAAATLSTLAGCDLVIEAVFEDLAVKEQVFRRLDALMKPGAILASNTSTLDLDRIAAFTRRPADVVGLHFFSPAQVMKLLEVVRGRQTAPDVLATALAFGRRIGKTCVVAGVCDGFIGNRMLEQYLRQAGFLLDEGCTPQQVDRAIEAFGFAMGPFRMSDLAGNDIGWAIRRRRALERPGLRYSASADRLCELGRFGQKTGAGWYDYAPGSRDALPSPVVATMLDALRAGQGVAARPIDDEEIVQRLVYALVNEGVRLLEEGIAMRAGDIDVVYLTGYGFPPSRGGPMFHAGAVGLPRVVQAMRRFADNPHDDAGFWQPAPLLAALAAAGRSFE